MDKSLYPNEGGELNDFILIRTDQYVSMEEEEFNLSEDDIKWLLSHTEYDEKELNTMLAGEILIKAIISLILSTMTRSSTTCWLAGEMKEGFKNPSTPHFC